MRKVAVCVALAVAVLMIGNAAWAFNFADHVKVAQNGKGDTLIFPFYAALNGGWETKLWVINTAADRSVVAKVVIRSPFYSQELLDFLIYLTPTDVWTATIRYNNGRVEIFSDDDSMVQSATAGTTPVWANTTNVMQPLNTPKCSDINSYGYVEVFESAHSYNGSSFSPSTGGTAISLNVPALTNNKNAVYNAYADLSTGKTINQGLVLDGINVLTGVMEFSNAGINQRASLQAIALRDYGATLGASGAGASALTVSKYTFFGGVDAFNTIDEVEASIAKNDLSMYYSDKSLSLHALTFPTKLTIVTTTTTGCTLSTASPYFLQRPMDANGCISYTATHYDTTEQSASAAAIFSPAQQGTVCKEVELLTGFSFNKGWARYTLPSGTAFNTKDPAIVGNASYAGNASYDGMYTGAPVIGSVVHLGSDGYSAVPAAYTDGLVTSYSAAGGLAAGGPINYYYYQYQDERNAGTVSGNNNTVNGVAHDGYDANRPALGDAPYVNENQTRAATAAQQGSFIAQPPAAADTYHPVQTATPNEQ